MSVVLFLMLAGAVLWLGKRVTRLEAEVAQLRTAQAPVAGPTRQPLLASADEPVAAPPVSSVEAPLEERRTMPGWRPSLGFEDLFGRLLPIWAGGVTLAVAGFFLVRWSIEAGLLTPPVRVALAGQFGLFLIAGAEVANRWRERVADPRVAQALAGAGLATLYAAFYLAGTRYGLIGSTLAFVGLASVTGAAIALSYRFGSPSAVLGLVGGFAAPALVGSEEANLPLLTLYLALVTGGLTLTGKRQARAWLGMAALAAGLGWGALLVARGVVRTPDVTVIGAYLVLLGAIVPALAIGGTDQRAERLVRVGAGGLAALQLAVLVAGRFGALEWSLYLLLGAALAWFAWRDYAMRPGNALAAAVGVALLALWSAPTPQGFAVASALLAAIFAGVPLAQIARGHGGPLAIAQMSGVALGTALAALWHFGALFPADRQPLMALALIALAAAPGGAVALARRADQAGRSSLLSVAEATAALLAFGALAQVLPYDALAWMAAAAAAAIAWRAGSLAGAAATFALIAAAWAAQPLVTWLQAGSFALAGEPMLAAALPAARTVALDVVPSVVGGLAWAYVLGPASPMRRFVLAGALAIAAIAGHSLFRHGLAAMAGGDFVATGVIERTLWEGLLLGAGWLARGRGWSKVAVALALAALAHFAWFALALHNPLWSRQAVGPLRLVNLLLPAYAVAAAALLALRRWLAGPPPAIRWAIDGAGMALIAVLALSELRQAFAGSLLASAPVSQTEGLLRSLLGIVLAIGFLWWGSRTGERSWRIGSLLLMVIAVLKVFLVDAAGLAGLARIASFMALGFSLIGIGWFYARHLRAPAAVRP